MKTRLVALAMAAGCIGLNASAAEGPTVYRCGNTYQHTPCADGKALDNDDARSPAEVAAAKDVAAQDRQRAEAMVRDRERQEASTTPATATGIGVQRPPQPAPAAHKTGKPKSRKADRTARSGDFVAMAPGKRKSAKPM